MIGSGRRERERVNRKETGTKNMEEGIARKSTEGVREREGEREYGQKEGSRNKVKKAVRKKNGRWARKE